MKVRLKVNLKVAQDYTEERGTVFDDTDAPFPEHIQENLGDHRIIEVLVATVEPVQETELDDETEGSEQTEETTDGDQENEAGDGTEGEAGLAETEGLEGEGATEPSEATTETAAPVEEPKAPVALVRPKKNKKA